MYVTIRNQAKHLLICPLNSGKTIHLAPSETSKPVDYLEINGNEKISKLERSGLVTIAAQEGDDGQPAVVAGRRRRKEKV